MIIPEKTINTKAKIIGLESGLLEIYQTILSVAKYNINILLIGETGTGKELLTDFIHTSSTYNHGNIIKINCAALPDTLLESELFGYDRGAFTGAIQSKKGKIELAENGTLFLDEIGEIKPELQAKLLRVLQNKEVSRIGSNVPRKINFRLICATNKDLRNTIQAGKFREDLFYRIATFPIYVPALRERKADIKILSDYIIEQICIKTDLVRKKIEKKAIKILESHNWPGNIRELENVLYQALVYSQHKNSITAENVLTLLKHRESGNYHRIIKELIHSLISEKITLKTINYDIIKALFEYYTYDINLIREATGMSRDQVYRYKRKLTSIK